MEDTLLAVSGLYSGLQQSGFQTNEQKKKQLIKITFIDSLRSSLNLDEFILLLDLKTLELE